jgi:methylmalonyl-CoA carboxyltransferase small subunit
LKLQITIDGKAYAVDVEVLEDEESPAPRGYAPQHRTHAAGAQTQYQGGTWDADAKVCRSPVMGLVIKVNVEPGQPVETNELIMVLESMKMETNITATRPGKVKRVHVAASDSVKVDQILVEFE